MSKNDSPSTPAIFKSIDMALADYMAFDDFSSHAEKAYKAAQTVTYLRENMTEDFMKNIVSLQGTRIGFLTDRDKKKVNGQQVKGDGYPSEIIRDVVIDALMNGFRLTGNEFNIIGGNMYPTKEGFMRILNEYSGLSYDFDIDMPIQDKSQKFATTTAHITYSVNGNKNTKDLKLNIKSDSYATNDSIIGKAQRKAACWLVNKLKGTSFADVDVNENDEIIVINGEEEVKAIEDMQGIELSKVLEANKDIIDKYIDTLDKKDGDAIRAKIDRGYQILENGESSNYMKVIIYVESLVEKINKENE